MQHYNTSTEPKTERVALIQGCDPRRQSRYQTETRGEIEIIILRRAIGTHDDSGGYRLASWANSKVSAVRSEYFSLRCTFALSPMVFSNKPLNDFRAEFEAPLGKVTQQDVKDMARTMKAVENRAKMHPREGHAVEFLIYATDILKSLGVHQWVGWANDTARGQMGVEEHFIPLPYMKTRVEHIRSLYRAIADVPTTPED